MSNYIAAEVNQPYAMELDEGAHSVIIKTSQTLFDELQRIRQLVIDQSFKSISVKQSNNEVLKHTSVEWINSYVEKDGINADIHGLECGTEVKPFLNALYEVQKTDWDETIFCISADYFTISVRPIGYAEDAIGTSKAIYFQDITDDDFLLVN